MVSSSSPIASWFLWIAGVVFLGAYALPLLIVPLRWARLFRWRVPPEGERDLTVYLARSLGGVVAALVAIVFRAAPDAASHRLVLEMVIAATSVAALVHVWGALRRSQPWTETVEIVLFGAVAAGALWIHGRVP